MKNLLVFASGDKDGGGSGFKKLVEAMKTGILQANIVGVVSNHATGGVYKKALELGADIVVMLHPDYQYTPKLITAMVSIIGQDLYPVVFGSRILGKGALNGGMPMYKYISNRFLTFFQNVLMNQKLSEYHTGYRAFSGEVLRSLDLSQNSDDFIFDNQMIAQIFYNGFEIGEVTCPTKYFEEASSINFSRSVTYGLGVLKVSILYFMAKQGIFKDKIFSRNPG